MKCDQCQQLRINGMVCHEIGCPNMRKTWVADREEWVLYLECSICGDDVEEGTVCDCSSIDWDPSEADEDEVGEELQ